MSLFATVVSMLSIGFVFAFLPPEVVKTSINQRILTAVSLQVSTAYFTSSRPLVIASLNGNIQTETILIQELLTKLHPLWPKMIVTSNTPAAPQNSKTLNFDIKPESYILVLNIAEDIDELIKVLTSNPLWNPRAKFLVVLPRHEETISVVKRVIAAMWQKKCAQVTVMVPSTSQTTAVNIHTWFPYASNSCDVVRDIVTLDQYEDGKGFRKRVNLFPSKYPRDLHNCTVKFTLIPWSPFVVPLTGDSNALLDAAVVDTGNVSEPHTVKYVDYQEGLEVKMAKLLAKASNFTLLFREPPRDPWDGLYKELDDGETEGGFGALMGDADMQHKYDFTDSFIQEEVSWFVPIGKPYPRWQSMFHPFSRQFWLIVFLVYLTVSLVMWLMARQRWAREQRAWTNAFLVFLNNWSIILGESVKEKPEAGSLRIFYVIWVFYCLQINTAYQSGLISDLTTDDLKPRMTSQREILDSGVEFGFTSLLDPFFEDSPEVLARRDSCPKMKRCLKRMAVKGDFAMVSTRQHLEYESLVSYAKLGPRRFHPLQENLLVYNVVAYLPRGSHLLPRYNDVIRRVLSSGIVNKWWEDLTGDAKTRMEDDEEEDEEDEAQPDVLTIAHFEGAFYLLFLGLIISSTAFLMELAQHLRAQHLRMSNQRQRALSRTELRTDVLRRVWKKRPMKTTHRDKQWINRYNDVISRLGRV